MEINLGAAFQAMLDEDNDDFLNTLKSFLTLPDDTIEQVGPFVLASYKKEYAEGLKNANLEFSETQIQDFINEYNNLPILLGDLPEQLKEFTGEYSKKKVDFISALIATMYQVTYDHFVKLSQVQIPFELCHEKAKAPTYANDTDAGMDVYALSDITIAPGETVLVPTGIKMAIPEGYELQVRPKSGRALKTKLRVANTPGTIDSGYRDEIKVIIENIEPPIRDIIYSFDNNGKITIDSILHGSAYYITEGDKFAQLVLNKIEKAHCYQVSDINIFEGDRGGGFGSTGLK